MLRAEDGSEELADMKQLYHGGKPEVGETTQTLYATNDWRPTITSIHRVVLGDDPLARLVLDGDGE